MAFPWSCSADKMGVGMSIVKMKSIGIRFLVSLFCTSAHSLSKTEVPASYITLCFTFYLCELSCPEQKDIIEILK